MRVICPYTTLSQGCAACLDRWAPHAERVDVSGDPLDYWRLLCRVWADGQDFILIEHDQDFDVDVIPTLELCPHPHCKADEYFRLARFRSALMKERPDAFSGMPPSQRHWLVLENFARNRLGPFHSHIGDLCVSNMSGNRWFDRDDVRRRLWFEWMREELPRDGDEYVERAWAAVTDSGGPCGWVSCRRRRRVPFPSICDRCSDDALPEVAWPPIAPG